MRDHDLLARQFEEHRDHLQSVAYRMLGSLPEAEDAVQEAWLRLSRSDTDAVANLGGWLTTVVARVCLDMLRSRDSRREESLDTSLHEPIAQHRDARDAEHETLLADSVGIALLVVLDTLNPAERLAFVLHEMFGVPFEEIATIVGRSPAAARQLASRARRRVRGATTVRPGEIARQRQVVEAFLAALRNGDFEALVAVLDPDVVIRADAAAAGAASEVRGARVWAKQAVAFGHLARVARPALVDGAVGLVVAPHGTLKRALHFTFQGDKIIAVEVIADPARLREMAVAPLEA